MILTKKELLRFQELLGFNKKEKPKTRRRTRKKASTRGKKKK